MPSDVGPVEGSAAFVIQSCGESGSSAGWTIGNINTNSATLSSGADCPPTNRPPGYPASYQQAGLWLSDRLTNAGGGPESAAFDRVETTFGTLAGTTITRLQYWRSIKKEAEDNYEAYISLSSRNNVIDTCEIAGDSFCYVGGDDWYPNDATTVNRGAYRDLGGLSASSIILGMYCRDNVNHLCGNGFSLTNIDVQIFSAFLTIADPVAPSVGTPVGAGWTQEGWVGGTLPLAMSSSDNTGVSATRVYADGSLVGTLQRSCSYDRPRPCSDEPTGAVGLSTAGLADGSHVISVGAVDAGGTETKVTRPTELLVDNNAPAAPVGLASPEAVSATNSFSASWTLPSDAGSPIVAARYQLCQADVCGPVRTAPSLTGVDGLVLPAAGEGTLRLWLVDELGHEAPGAAATVKLTYAPAVPDAPVGP
ncbi:MAG: hypothetical protein JWR63_2763, partial [Conexibacter sp.]|nr:hypothetical protein [Conexibacter sp.]